ncbi:hypothetical protein QW131_22585 [Roseibium salinum]|nr:hypothetical protein [Roseibium salinum]
MRPSAESASGCFFRVDLADLALRDAARIRQKGEAVQPVVIEQRTEPQEMHPGEAAQRLRISGLEAVGGLRIRIAADGGHARGKSRGSFGELRRCRTDVIRNHPLQRRIEIRSHGGQG